MRLRNDDGAWSAWQPFANEVAWTLNSTPGLRTVDVEMRSGATIKTNSDTITYVDPDAPANVSSVDAGVDGDGNGLFDQLVIDVNIEGLLQGDYTASARLLAANGAEIGRMKHVGHVDSDTPMHFVINSPRFWLPVRMAPTSWSIWSMKRRAASPNPASWA